MKLQLDQVETPIGTMLFVTAGDRLCAVDFADYRPRMEQLLRRHYPAFDLVPGSDSLGVASRTHAYFAGVLTAFDDLPLDAGGTPFQQRVWAALRRIPPGRTLSYGALAAQLGQPGASRAVGLANGSNPISVVVPCHRVIGADGSLTGYGGGMARKEWLLRHEGALPESGRQPRLL